MRHKQLCEIPKFIIYSHLTYLQLCPVFVCQPTELKEPLWPGLHRAQNGLVFSVYNAGDVAFNGSQNGSLNCNSTDGSIHTEERYCVISCSMHCTLQQCQRLLLDVSCRLSEAMLRSRTFMHS